MSVHTINCPTQAIVHAGRIDGPRLLGLSVADFNSFEEEYYSVSDDNVRAAVVELAAEAPDFPPASTDDADGSGGGGHYQNPEPLPDDDVDGSEEDGDVYSTDSEAEC